MNEDKIFEEIKGVKFSPIFREDVLKVFKESCRDSYIDFLNLFYLTSEIDSFLSTKINKDDNSTKEYFTRLLNIRIRDHFSSSLILVSQGFIVDAISLTRSSLEDLLVIINFYISKTFFKRWNKNEREFRIVVGNLRRSVKDSSLFKKEDGEFFDDVYAALSGIVHPNLNSIKIMSTYHPTFNSINEVNYLKKYTDLIILSFYVYESQICSFLELIYPEDQKNLAVLKKSLKENIDINKYIHFEK